MKRHHGDNLKKEFKTMAPTEDLTHTKVISILQKSGRQGKRVNNADLTSHVPGKIHITRRAHLKATSVFRAAHGGGHSSPLLAIILSHFEGAKIFGDIYKRIKVVSEMRVLRT